MAAVRKEAGPESTFIDFTCPAGSTTASSVTLPVTKSRRASGGATARTDLISFGGTIGASSKEGAADSEAASLDRRRTARLAAGAPTADFSWTAAASATKSPGAGGAGTVSVECPTPPAGAGCALSYEVALG